jgi:hypothetical protein
MKKILNYGDFIKFEFKSEVSKEVVKLLCVLGWYKLTLENYAEAMENGGLHSKTSMVTIVPLDDNEERLYGRVDADFSKIKDNILQWNPEFEIRQI